MQPEKKYTVIHLKCHDATVHQLSRKSKRGHNIRVVDKMYFVNTAYYKFWENTFNASSLASTTT